MNVIGEAKTPMRKESEKLSVAKAERNIPNRRSEKHLIKMKCRAVGANDFVKIAHSTGGRITLSRVKT